MQPTSKLNWGGMYKGTRSDSDRLIEPSEPLRLKLFQGHWCSDTDRNDMPWSIVTDSLREFSITHPDLELDGGKFTEEYNQFQAACAKMALTAIEYRQRQSRHTTEPDQIHEFWANCKDDSWDQMIERATLSNDADERFLAIMTLHQVGLQTQRFDMLDFGFEALNVWSLKQTNAIHEYFVELEDKQKSTDADRLRYQRERNQAKLALQEANEDLRVRDSEALKILRANNDLNQEVRTLAERSEKLLQTVHRASDICAKITHDYAIMKNYLDEHRLTVTGLKATEMVTKDGKLSAETLTGTFPIDFASYPSLPIHVATTTMPTGTSSFVVPATPVSVTRPKRAQRGEPTTEEHTQSLQFTKDAEILKDMNDASIEQFSTFLWRVDQVNPNFNFVPYIHADLQFQISMYVQLAQQDEDDNPDCWQSWTTHEFLDFIKKYLKKESRVASNDWMTIANQIKRLKVSIDLAKQDNIIQPLMNFTGEIRRLYADYRRYDRFRQ